MTDRAAPRAPNPPRIERDQQAAGLLGWVLTVLAAVRLVAVGLFRAQGRSDRVSEPFVTRPSIDAATVSAGPGAS